MKLQQSNHKICIVGVKEMGDKGEKNFVEIIAKKKKNDDNVQREILNFKEKNSDLHLET